MCRDLSLLACDASHCAYVATDSAANSSNASPAPLGKGGGIKLPESVIRLDFATGAERAKAQDALQALLVPLFLSLPLAHHIAGLFLARCWWAHRRA